jgi:hypothetical protein
MAFTSGAKAQIFFMAGTAGINACSTPWGTGHVFDKGINACSTPCGTGHVFDKGLKACSTPWGKEQLENKVLCQGVR